MRSSPRIAVIGAGWAGLTAALDLATRGARVTLFEAAPQPGGRARRVRINTPEGHWTVDNGQHILIGAYTRCLARMRDVGLDPQTLLHRSPLDLRFLDGRGLALPDAPLALAGGLGLLRAQAWSWAAKVALVGACLRWAARGWRAAPDQTVADLTAHLPADLRRDWVDPLCVAALNTPAARASAAVFLRVIRDAFLGASPLPWRASDLLLPKVDLSACFPDAALARLQSLGAEVRLGHPVRALRAQGPLWAVDEEAFDGAVLACSQTAALRLLQDAQAPCLVLWRQQAQRLRFEAIATIYTHGLGARLPRPMVALDGCAQYVFDRGQLGGPPGLWAWVVSAASGERELIEAQVLAQAQAHGLGPLRVLQTVLERQATFACEAGLERPRLSIAPGLLAAGDYVQGPYPATLEGAVRSGEAAAAALAAELGHSGIL